MCIRDSIIGFLLMIPMAYLTALLWPKVQLGIVALQGFLKTSGVIGVFSYTFLERILIPTGLHHFIYGPFMFGPAVVEQGITAFWVQHIQEFSQSTTPLKELFPQGGFSLHGNSKVFGLPAAALAMYVTCLLYTSYIMQMKTSHTNTVSTIGRIETYYNSCRIFIFKYILTF